MDTQILLIDRLSGNDLTAEFTMRWRLDSDPDIAGSYTAVTTTKTVGGIITPYFDITTMPAEKYVIHTYFTTDGDTTGTKITIDLTAPAL